MSKYFLKFLPVEHYSGNDYGRVSNDEIESFSKKVAKDLNKEWALLTETGRHGMSILFQALKLKRRDEVFITTTFDYPNVSSCVTCTVFNYCKPSRVITEQTKAIFIIHEFGKFHPETYSLVDYGKKHGIPVVEDCAHTVFSFDSLGNRTGSIGDWTIISFPKIFPVSFGGLLVGNTKLLDQQLSYSDDFLKDVAVARGQWDDLKKIADRRRAIFNYYSENLNNGIVHPIYTNVNGVSPWFFPVEVTKPKKCLDYLRKNGIETGYWHGSNVIVLPLHQYIGDNELDASLNIINHLTGEFVA